MTFGTKFTTLTTKIDKKSDNEITMFEQNSVLNAVKFGRVKAIMVHGHIG
jgi:hypothetical protein